MEKLKNICDVAIKWIFGIAFCLVLLGIFNGSFGLIFLSFVSHTSSGKNNNTESFSFNN